jgi:hypothetical protein
MKKIIELVQYAYFALITLGLFVMATDGDIIDPWSLAGWIIQLLVVYYIYTFGAKK